MSLLTDLYHKTLAENEKSIRFWEDYLQNLKSLDFNIFADKLKVPVMVPLGSRILFRGELKHTNEITVSLGADYFVKCSVKQAEVLRQHRIKDAETKLDVFKKEREYIENQVSFKNENIFDKQGQEIIEVHTKEEDMVWREKHRENVKQWKQKKIDDNKTQAKITDEELWERLEELELQEELENELMKEENVSSEKDFKEPCIVMDESRFEEKAKEQKITEDIRNKLEEAKLKRITEVELEKKVTELSEPTRKVAGKLELLQKVRDKQFELEEKLLELRNQDRSGKSKTEQDLISKLDEIESLEELEDEMDRLDDMIDTENITSEEELEEENTEITPEQPTDGKRRVSFADQDDSETLELTFYHSDVEASKEPYDAEKGITKPSNVYEAFSNLFTQTTSILKKKKYEDKDSNLKLPKVEKKSQVKKKVEWLEEEDNAEERTIIVKDVVEKVDTSENKLDGAETRPMSLFKQRRQQKK